MVEVMVVVTDDKATKPATTVQVYILVFVCVTLLDTFNETFGQFPAMFVVTKRPKTSGSFPAAFVVTYSYIT